MTYSPLNDPRVAPDSYIIYPTGYDDLVHSDKYMWCLNVQNGHKDGWWIGRGIMGSSEIVMNRKGEWKFSDPMNRRHWRYERDEAIQIALNHVDTNKLNGFTAQEASDRVQARLAQQDGAA